MRQKGKITNWNSQRGFGFVTPSGGGGRVFLHVTAICDRRRPPADGDMVTYDLAFDEKKRPRAVNVRQLTRIRQKFPGLACGWPGAVVAQRVLRHKSRKRSFQVAFWGTVVMNAVILGWLLTDKGSRVLDQLLR